MLEWAEIPPWSRYLEYIQKVALCWKKKSLWRFSLRWSAWLPLSWSVACTIIRPVLGSSTFCICLLAAVQCRGVECLRKILRVLESRKALWRTGSKKLFCYLPSFVLWWLSWESTWTRTSPRKVRSGDFAANIAASMSSPLNPCKPKNFNLVLGPVG